jgi:DNA (cytosine-5)-methyltransferase 1
LENVPGLLTSNQGRDFGTILLALDDAGFCHLEWRVLDSQFFGVPQRRRRVFLIASASIPGRRPLLVEREGSVWDPAENRGAGSPPTGAATGSSDQSRADSPVVVDFRHSTINAMVSPTLQAKNSGGVSLNYLPGVIQDV